MPASIKYKVNRTTILPLVYMGFEIQGITRTGSAEYGGE